MAQTPKAGRNDSCPCGSGKKYKRCCLANAQSSRSSRMLVAVLLAIVAGGIVVGVATFTGKTTTPAPAGKVWSSEHGHYH